MVATADGASVVVKAEVVLGDQRTAVEIAISTELAPQVAMALLATIATSQGERDGLAPALDVLAAAVIASSRAKRVRMHLLFEKGAVLPLEISLDAALALERGLAAELKSVLNAAEP